MPHALLSEGRAAGAIAGRTSAGSANSLGLAKPPPETRVVVAMSGGVDSSVVAALLSREGYDVLGVTLQLYDHGAATHRKGACCAGQDIQDARRVAEGLSIPHYVLDYESRFRERVIDRFAESYVAGETPIPCVACNQQIKFADLFETAADLGADALATGHYVASRPDGRGGRALYRAADPDRDQSYFLFATTHEQLEFLRFPLGDLPKAEVRGLAREFGLAVADKPDSQDICFVPSGKYTDVIERLRPGAAEPGDIVHLDGRILGRHAGVIHFTIGQRRGLGIGSGAAGGEPLYVVRLDPKRRRVIVGPRAALSTRVVHLREVNWIGEGPFGALPATGLDIAVRLRSTRPPMPAVLFRDGETARVELCLDEDAVSPGQACVFYSSTEPGARVLGGGFIRATESAAAAQFAQT
jgi:tRNA-specific 2-thiouridylase